MYVFLRNPFAYYIFVRKIIILFQDVLTFERDVLTYHSQKNIRNCCQKIRKVTSVKLDILKLGKCP